ncbi:MAG: glutamate 5-kinase [bacterium]
MSPTDKARSKLLSARRVVIKIGSRALVNKRGKLDQAVFRSVAADTAYLRERGRQVAIVSSGSILAGRNRLGLSRNLTMPQKQAAAAVGQHDLMAAWGRALGRHGLVSGQILVTTEDLGHRMRYLNSRNTMEELLSMGVVPVINENDTVAVEEIRYGDNDRIATLVVALMNADGLILLTDIDGLCSEDPARVKDAEIVHTVREGEAELYACAGPSHSGVGSGGMSSKIDAARTAANLGVPTVIANAKTENLVKRIMEGEVHGTLFVPEGPRMKDRHFFLAFAGEYKGTVKIDRGASRAIVEHGKSLLPSGIIESQGRFEKGDVIRVLDEGGEEVARGLTQYDSGDLKRIMGRKSSEIESVLGQKLYDEIIHRDYLVLTGGQAKK